MLQRLRDVTVARAQAAAAAAMHEHDEAERVRGHAEVARQGLCAEPHGSDRHGVGIAGGGGTSVRGHSEPQWLAVIEHGQRRCMLVVALVQMRDDVYYV
ncbi:MAG: hypothetical protein MUE62_12740, partial [Burkholderiaceae bacterium]|nr:hypothetical protein [Burkholderiaceae bacterium]